MNLSKFVAISVPAIHISYVVSTLHYPFDCDETTSIKLIRDSTVPCLMATEKGNDRAPVREQTREQLRACQTLIRELFEAHWQLLNKK